MTRGALISVFAGSRAGGDARFAAAAYELGDLIARSGHVLVYGGGNSGLMCALADGALAAGGKVIGIVPELYSRPELIHPGISEVQIVQDIHTRKHLVRTLGAHFVALPGGFGTLDEIVDLLHVNHIEAVPKVCALTNIDGFYDHFLDFLERSAECGMISPAAIACVRLAENVAEALRLALSSD